MLIRESRALFRKFMYREGIKLNRLLLEQGQRVEEVLLCRGCQGLAIRPLFCPKCKVLFCQTCAMRFDDPNCQQCRTERLIETVPQLYKIMLSKYKVVCRNKPEGCELVLYYENLEEHEDICHFERMKCVYPDCAENVERKNYPAHIRNCPLRLVNCHFCFKDFRHNDIAAHQLGCPMKMVQCSGCKRQVLNKFLSEHVEICDEVKVVCQRCELELKKAEISEHNEIDCMANVLRKFRSKSQEIVKVLKEEVLSIKQRIQENDNLPDSTCNKCGKASCEIALKFCELCRLKACSYCAKDLLKPCKSCSKLFCSVCFGTGLQQKSCLMCGDVFGESQDSSFEKKRSQGAVA